MNFKQVSGVALLAALTVQAGAAPPPVRQPQGAQVQVLREVHHDVSRPLRDLIAEQGPVRVGDPADNVVPNKILDFSDLFPGLESRGSALPAQRAPMGTPAPPVDLSVDGMTLAAGGNGIPPDTTGDVGTTAYMQWVNSSFSIHNKTTGARTAGPSAGNTFFAGFGGVCQTTNRGDPLVLFDDAAQRWVVSQFAFTSTAAAPWLQCVAVSTSADPLGTYNRYSFSYPNFNDYGKMGVWVTSDGTENAYLFTMHEFNTAGSFVGTSFAAVERDKMLAGQSAQFIRVSGIDAYGALPFHLEGANPLPAGACPMFVHFQSTGVGYRLWDLCVNWTNGTTTFVNTPTLLSSQPFALGLSGAPQLSSTQRLDDFGGNTMYLAAIRAFGAAGPTEAKAVITHAVDVGNDQAGKRWVEFGFSNGQAFANPNGVFANGFEDLPAAQEAITAAVLNKRIIDQGVYAPDTNHRWMGSINLDANGNIGLGYNTSGTALNPEIRLTGRERNDPIGVMRDEVTCTPPNTGAQTGTFGSPTPRPRWGDYSTMGVDPSNQCTFFFTGEYYATTSFQNWATRICKFTFPSCGQPDFEIEVQPQTRIQACGTGSTPTAVLRVGGYGTLTNPVTLGTTGLPGGVTAGFSPASVPAGFISTLTLTGGNTIAAGAYNFSVTGTSGAITRTLALGMDVSAALASAPTLTSPAAGATGVIGRPTLQWAAVTGANSYFVQIASDAGFNTVVDSGASTTTSYTSKVLLSVGQTYFWRVRSVNACGDGTFATARQFTVSAPGSCPAGTAVNTVFTDDISGDATAWVVDNISGDVAALWSKRIPPAGTGLLTRGWYAANSATTADQRLTSPTIVLPSIAQSPIIFGFDAHHQYETDGAVNCWDGGLVEISTDGGTSYQALGNQRTLADAYPGSLSSGNPAQGADGWCRQAVPGTAIRTYFTLDNYAGQSVKLRFRSTADSNTVGTTPNGWAVDNVAVQSCQ